MKKTLLLLVFLFSAGLPLGTFSQVDDPDFFFPRYVTLTNGTVYEAIYPFPWDSDIPEERILGNLEAELSEIRGNGTIHFYMFSDENFTYADNALDNATFLYKIEGTEYYRQSNGEVIAYRPIVATPENRTENFVIIRNETIPANSGIRNPIGSEHLIPYDWKLALVYIGHGNASLRVFFDELLEIDIVSYREISVSSSAPTILDFVNRRQPMNLTIGLVDPIAYPLNLTVVWTTKNITSNPQPMDFMDNPFTYQSKFTGNSTAYFADPGVSLIRSVNLTEDPQTIYLDHPYYTFYTNGVGNFPYEQTPFHLLFFAENNAYIWFRLTLDLDTDYVELLHPSPHSSVTEDSTVGSVPVGFFELMPIALFFSLKMRFRRRKIPQP